jgi:hypothetical protein
MTSGTSKLNGRCGGRDPVEDINALADAIVESIETNDSEPRDSDLFAKLITVQLQHWITSKER